MSSRVKAGVGAGQAMEQPGRGSAWGRPGHRVRATVHWGQEVVLPEFTEDQGRGRVDCAGQGHRGGARSGVGVGVTGDV